MRMSPIREKPFRKYVESEMMDLLPGEQLRWYALQCVGGQENVAAAHLVGRRFGVYLPLELTMELKRGKPVIAQKPLLTGYLFVAVPDIARHWERIHAVPGAIEVLSTDGGPRRITDAEIREIREVENLVMKLDMPAVAYSGRRRRSRRSRRARIPRPSVDRRGQINQLVERLRLSANVH